MEVEEEATLDQDLKYPPEDTFVTSFSKRIVQKLDLILYTIAGLVVDLNFLFPPALTPQS